VDDARLQGVGPDIVLLAALVIVAVVADVVLEPALGLGPGVIQRPRRLSGEQPEEGSDIQP